MIKSIKAVKGAEKFPCQWWEDVKALKRRKFIFKEGLNIIIGPNGSGKTTLTRTLARMFYAEQGGMQTITQSAIWEMFETLNNTPHSESFEIDHDGGAVFYMNSADTVGITGGHFDDDFFQDGFKSTAEKVSAGQNSARSFLRICGIAKEYRDNKDSKIIDNRFENSCNSYYEERIEKVLEFLKPNRESIPTLILDEPAASVDLEQEIYLWKIIRDISSVMQVIVCTHSILGLESKANFIEMKKGYRKKCLDNLTELKGG